MDDDGDDLDVVVAVDILYYSAVEGTNWVELCAAFHPYMDSSMCCTDIDVAASCWNQTV